MLKPERGGEKMVPYNKERRFARRVMSHNVKIIFFQYAEHEGVVLNISEGGICVISPGLLQINQYVNLNFLLPNKDDGDKNVPIMVIGQVVWQENKSDVTGMHHAYKYGITFVKILEEHLKIIKNFVTTALER